MTTETENLEPSDNPEDYRLLMAYQISCDVAPLHWEGLQVKAAKDKAPRDAIYYNQKEGWKLLRDCEPEFQQRIKDYLDNLANEILAASKRYMEATRHAKQFGYARPGW